MGPVKKCLRACSALSRLLSLSMVFAVLAVASVCLAKADDDTTITPLVSSYDFGGVLKNEDHVTADLGLNKTGQEKAKYDAEASDKGLKVEVPHGGNIGKGDQIVFFTIELEKKKSGTGTVGLKTWMVTVQNKEKKSSAGPDMGSDDPDDDIIVTATVYDGALLTSNAGSVLNHGSSVLINNAPGPYRAAAFVDSVEISPRWALNNLAVGSSIAAGSGTPTAFVSFDASGLLNGQTLRGRLKIALENDQSILGAKNRDLGMSKWKLEQAVTGNVGAGTAEVKHKDSYAGLYSVSDMELGSVATILAGTNKKAGKHNPGKKTTVSMSWRNRSITEQWLQSDVVTLGGVDGDVFVLQMTYDDTLNAPGNEELFASLGCMYVYWYDPDRGMWVNAIDGNQGRNKSKIINFQGTWQEAGYPMQLGAWGVDIEDNVVWAVIDHGGDFAPEPGTVFLLAFGGLSLLCRRRRQAPPRPRAVVG